MSGKLNYQFYKSVNLLDYKDKDLEDIYDEEKTSSGTISNFSELTNLIGTKELVVELTGWMIVPKDGSYKFNITHDDGIDFQLLTNTYSSTDTKFADTSILFNDTFKVDDKSPEAVDLKSWNAYKVRIRLKNNSGPAGILKFEITDSDTYKEVDFNTYFYNNEFIMWPKCYMGFIFIGLLIIMLIIILSTLGIIGRKRNYY